MCQPYTYRIKFLPTGQEYYGVRHGKKANPETFWQTYFTSSKVVKKLIEEHGTEAFEIVDIKTHTDKETALWYEELFLVSVDAGRSEHWLNRHNGCKNFCTDTSEEGREANSKRLKKFYYNNPGVLAIIGKRVRESYASNPEIGKMQGKRIKENYKNNPEIIESIRNNVKRYFESSEARERCSRAQKERFKDPEARDRLISQGKQFWESEDSRIAQSKKAKKQWAEPENRKRMSDIKKEFHLNNPEAGKAHGARMRVIMSDPIRRVRMSLASSLTYAKKAGRPFSYIPGRELK